MKRLLPLIALTTPISLLANDFDRQIDDRQQAFTHIENELESTKRLLGNRNTDWVDLTERSEALQQYGELLHVSFPLGSHSESKAKKKVWDNPEKFERLLNQMTASFDTLSQASQQQDKALAKKSLKSANSTCKNCHRSYRSRW
ncbi:cytochrome c [uncultured Vibrio sp.]|uniref:c-type cytochrome n=1 Tax=uncultured Vibrio sp. TaxID=114054 RepID=UPI0025CBF813|nr:cytochrome c [uncultured Vibrio sp.]